VVADVALQARALGAAVMRLVLGAMSGRGGARERWLSGTSAANAWRAAVRTPNIARAGAVGDRVVLTWLRGSRVKLKRVTNISKVCVFHLSRIALR
jgi:hypothetical protein